MWSKSATTISERGELAITVSGTLATPQSFALNPQLLKGATVSAGSIAGDRWTLPAGKTNATLQGNIAVAGKAWRPAPSNYAYKRKPLVKARVQGNVARRLQHRELLLAQGQLRARPVVRGAGPRR